MMISDSPLKSANEPEAKSPALPARGGTLPKYTPKHIPDIQAHLRRIEALNKSGANVSLSDFE